MNGTAHTVAGGIAGGTLALAVIDVLEDETPLALLAAIGGGIIGGKLPDKIEPAYRNPNHRQAFHSVAVLGGVGWSIKALTDWHPEAPFDRLLKYFLLGLAAGYASHLLMDSVTQKSIPMIGRIA